MLKILLACNAGMSTSMLMKRMNKAAEARGLDATIDALPITAAEKVLADWDIVMLGPQVRHMKKTLEEPAKKANTKVEVIDMRDYGMMNGERVLDAALKTIGE